MTLLSIVGEDTSRIIPLLYAYREKIKNHVLLCDDDLSNYERAKTLQKGMQKFSDTHSLGWYIKVLTTDEDSEKEIKNISKKAFDFDGELWLNVTDGYPTMTILLSDMVRKKGGKVLSYDHFDNDLHIMDSDGRMKCKQLKSRMDIESYMMLLNYKIISKTKRTYLKSRKENVLKLFKTERDFKKVRKALVSEELGYAIKLKKQHFPEIMKSLKELNIVHKNGMLIKDEVKTIQGDLFEEYVYWLCEGLGFDDMVLGAVIDYDPQAKEPFIQRRVINEFDILAMHKNRLYVIECKFSSKLNGTGLIYKYETIVNYFGRAAKAMVFNISKGEMKPYLNTNTSKNFGHSALRRARMSDIGIYHETHVDVIKFQNYVRNFFKLGA